MFIVSIGINTSIAFLSLLNCVYFFFFLLFSPLRLLKVSMLHLLAMNCLLGPALTLLDIPPTPHLNKRFYVKRLIPLAISKGLGSISSHFSLWRVPVSYLHTGE